MQHSSMRGVSLQWISSPGEGMMWNFSTSVAKSSFLLGDVEARMMSGLFSIFLDGSLSDGFVEADACGDADVEAVYFACHWKVDEDVTVFFGEAPHARAFCSHDDAEGSFKV